MRMIDAPNVLLAVDPGKSTGWAVYKKGLMADMGICRTPEEFDIWLDGFEAKYGTPDVVVYEGFKLFRHKAKQQIGSEFEVSQVIGITTSFARRNNAEAVKQYSDILPTAVMWSKMRIPKDHSVSHNIVAANHAVYYLVKNDMILPNGI
jgi:hypothetical protein